MADVSKLNVAGTTYNIKDNLARADLVDVNVDITDIKQAIADTSASYNSENETITFSYGVI